MSKNDNNYVNDNTAGDDTTTNTMKLRSRIPRRASIQVSGASKPNSSLVVGNTKAIRKDEEHIGYIKEQKSLQTAHNILVEEYHRRVEVRKNLKEKFGRAQMKFKLLMSERNAWGNTAGANKRGTTLEVSRSISKQNDKRQRSFKFFSYYVF